VTLVLLFFISWFAVTVSGAAGFGGALILLPVLTNALGADTAVPKLTVIQLFGNLSRAWFGRREIRWRPVLFFILGAIPMSIVGSLLFADLPKDIITRGIGVLIVVLVVVRRLSLVRFELRERGLFLGGALTGLLSGLAGSAGPLGCGLLPWAEPACYGVCRERGRKRRYHARDQTDRLPAVCAPWATRADEWSCARHGDDSGIVDRPARHCPPVPADISAHRRGAACPLRRAADDLLLLCEEGSYAAKYKRARRVMRRQTLRSLVAVILLAACSRVGSIDGPTALPSPAFVAPTTVSTATTLPSPVPKPTRPQATPASTQVQSPSPALPSYDLVLRGGTLIDGSGGPPVPDAAIAIRDGRIAALGSAATLVFATETEVRELPGATFLPGFVNAHVHTSELNDDQLRRWTAAGVTTVRDLSGPLDLLAARRDTLAASADAAMPRLLIAGPMVTVPGGHPLPIYGPSDRVLAVRGAEDAAAQTAWLIDAGVDVIKIAVSGRTDTNWPELSDAEIRAITETAHAGGVRVTAHVDRAVALRRAVANGIDDAAHMPRDRMPDELIAEMVARNVALVPTIDVYEGLAEERENDAEWRRSVLPVMYDNLARFAAAGGTLALGDDYGNPRVALGMPLPEMRHWLASGLTPMQVIVAATHGGAIVCGLEGEIGQLKPGTVADIVVVEGDPLQDIGVLERVMFVFRGGQVAYVP
jgi:imidazolonepropionase-like amidohydrolase